MLGDPGDVTGVHPDPDALFILLRPLVDDGILELIAELDSIRMPEAEVRAMYAIRDSAKVPERIGTYLSENLFYLTLLKQLDLEKGLADYENTQSAKGNNPDRAAVAIAWGSAVMLKGNSRWVSDQAQQVLDSAARLGPEVALAADQLLAWLRHHL